MDFRLEDDVLGVLTLDCDSGYVITQYDLGFPQIRDVVNPRTVADGTLDTTRFIGSRAVSISFHLNGNAAACAVLRDQLAAYAHPARRPLLYVTEDFDTRARVMQLRGTQAGAPIAFRKFNAMAVSWVCPNGIIESAADNTVTVFASETGTTTGITFPITFPLGWPAAPTAGVSTVVNAGTADVYPMLLLYGPCTDPMIENLETGQKLSFTGLTILAGEYLEIETRNKTIRYQSNPADSRYNTLDFTVSSWWRLQPGIQQIRYRPVSFSVPCQAQVIWKHGWI